MEELRVFFSSVVPHLNEKQRRVVAGAMARSLGRRTGDHEKCAIGGGAQAGWGAEATVGSSGFVRADDWQVSVSGGTPGGWLGVKCS